MTILHLLKDFSDTDPIVQLGPPEAEPQEVLSEDLKLEAFERGYQAGWDDAIASQSGQAARLSEALDGHLRDLSFTYHEALGQMTENLRPALRCLFDEVLPNVLSQTLGARLTEDVTRMCQQSAARSVILLVPDGMGQSVRELMSGDSHMPVSVREQPGLAETEIRIVLDDATHTLDAQRSLSAIEAALTDYLFNPQSEVRDAKSI